MFRIDSTILDALLVDDADLRAALLRCGEDYVVLPTLWRGFALGHLPTHRVTTVRGEDIALTAEQVDCWRESLTATMH